MKTNILSINTIMETTYSIKNFAMRIVTAVFLLCVLCVGNAWGDVSTLTFTDACSGSGTADDAAEWTVTSDGAESTYDPTKGIHYGTSKAAVQYIELSTSDITGTITKVVVNASTGSSVDATVSVTVGGDAFGGDAQTLSDAATDYTFNGSATGEIVVTITKPSSATKALYCKSIAVTYSTGGGGGGGSTYTVTYDNNGGTGSITDSNSPYSSGAVVTVKSSSGFLAPSRYTFHHWNTAADNSGTSYNPDETFTISSNTTLYAQWVSSSFTLLTDMSNLAADDEVIIVDTDVSRALSTTQSSNNRTGSADFITNLDGSISHFRSGAVQVLTIGVGETANTWTFYATSPIENSTGYLYAASSSANHLKTQETNNANGEWTIEIGEGNVASIVANGTYTHNIMRYNANNGSPIFACYATASQTALKIYYRKALELTFFRTKCYREFTDEEGDGLWGTDGNWTNSHQPNINDLARIKKPVTVDVTDAKAKNVILNQNGNTGKLTIQANKALEVAGTVTRTTDGSNSLPTRPEDLILESSSAGNATLIFDNSNSDQATVYLYSKGYTNKIIGDGGVWNWQFIGVPVTNATRLSDYYDGYMYEWDNSIPGWVDKTDFDATLTPFTAYSVSYPTTSDNLHTYEIDGTLVATGNKSIDIPKNTSVMAVANSWTAPIDIASITFTNTSPQNIFLYNTGYNYEDKAGTEGTRFAPGKYICVPKNSASLVGEPFIASMQGFLVKNKLNTDGTINIDYNTVVRPSTSREIVAGEMHAPARNKKEEEVAPVVMKIFVIGSEYDDRVILLEREDFSRGFDDGWDGEKFQVNAVKTAPRLFAINETGGKEEVSAVPEMEGTVIGFRPGTDANYKITFDYEGEKTLYLLDTKTGFSTLICKTCEYEFSSNGENEDARFIIAKSPATATGVDNSTAGSANVYKMVLDDHIYIIRNGKMYDVTGILCK